MTYYRSKEKEREKEEAKDEAARQERSALERRIDALTMRVQVLEKGEEDKKGIITTPSSTHRSWWILGG